MARVRVVVYREGSDSVVEDFIVSDPDKSSHKLGDEIMQLIPDDKFVGHTDELIAEGESV